MRLTEQYQREEYVVDDNLGSCCEEEKSSPRENTPYNILQLLYVSYLTDTVSLMSHGQCLRFFGF